MYFFQKLQSFEPNLTKLAIVDGFLFHLRPNLGGRWSLLTGGRCSEADLVLKLLGRDFEWSLLTGGCNSEVVVSTGLSVLPKSNAMQKTLALIRCGNLASLSNFDSRQLYESQRKTRPKGNPIKNI